MKENIKGMLHYTRQAFGVSLVLMLVCGLLFPLLLSGLSAVLFPHQAEGSLIEINGKAVAAENVGQEFTEDYYLWSRPSAYHRKCGRNSNLSGRNGIFRNWFRL